MSQGHPLLGLYQVWKLCDLCFYLWCGQTDKQTDSKILPTPTNRVAVGNNNNINNNNNSNSSLLTMLMLLYDKVILRVHPVHLMNVQTCQGAADPPPPTKPTDSSCESTCCCLHQPSPFIITQPERWYSFYRSTEGRRLSRLQGAKFAWSFHAAATRSFVNNIIKN